MSHARDKEERKLLAKALRLRLEEMIRVEEIGQEGTQVVRLHLESAQLELVRYERARPFENGDPKGAAHSARRLYIDQIADRLCDLSYLDWIEAT